MATAVPLSLFASSAGAAVDADESERDDFLVTPTGGRTIRTVGEAVQHVRDLLEAQLARATDLGTTANAAAPGDGAVRNAFYTLLAEPQQREVFMGFCRQMTAWPRLRSLFGAPPYGFLRAEDAGMLRAAGIASNRTNMAHETAQAAASYSQFGAAQLTDGLERDYRVVRRQNVNEADPLPFTFEVRDAPDVLLHVRVKRRSREAKLEMLRDQTQREKLVFPRAGERLALQETKRMLRLTGTRVAVARSTNLVVKRVVPRGENASTAAVICVVTS